MFDRVLKTPLIHTMTAALTQVIVLELMTMLIIEMNQIHTHLSNITNGPLLVLRSKRILWKLTSKMLSIPSRKKDARVLLPPSMFRTSSIRSKMKLKMTWDCTKILVHKDFAESYQNIPQNKIQKAYFGHNNFSICTTCCYIRSTKASKLDIHSTATVTEENSSTPAILMSDECAYQFTL